MGHDETSFLPDLIRTIRQRRKTMPGDSYVASLFRKGKAEILKKIGEEAFEVSLAAMEGEVVRNQSVDAASYAKHQLRPGRASRLKAERAAVQGSRKRLISELADLWFHILILMVSENVSLGDIGKELARRKGKKRRK